MAKSSPYALKSVGQLHLDEDHDYDFGVTSNDDPQIRVSMHETHEDRGAIWTRLTISFLKNGDPTFPPMYGPVRINLMRSDRGGLTGVIEQVAEKYSTYDWEHMITSCKHHTIRALEEALPMTSLIETVEEAKQAPYLIYPYIATSGVTVLYGDGGTGKSTLALALALEVSTGVPIISTEAPLRTGPVLYADYEDDDSQHANRVRAIARAHNLPADMVEIYHLPMVGRMTRETKRIRRRLHETGAELVVLDSIGMGRGGDAVGAEDTIRMFRSLRSLEKPVLAIDHISKQSKSSKRDPDPYGSVYTRNSSRMMWYVEKRAARLGDPWDYLAFTHTKANHVRKSGNQYLKVKYQNAQQDTGDGLVNLIHSIRFEATDVQGMPEADKAPEDAGRIRLLDEITAWIWSEGEPKSVKEVAEHFDKTEDTVRRTMNRGVEDGELTKLLESGTTYYEIAEDDDKPIPF